MYKLLLCWRYLRTRYIALASIISVMLGVATMIVVNGVMAGFTTEMQDRIHGILADLTFEARSLEGLSDPEGYMQRINEVAVLKTLGFSDRLLFGLVIAEAATITLAGGLLGVFGAKLLFEGTGFQGAGFLPGFAVKLSTAGLGMLIALLLGLISGLVPAWQASRHAIASCFRAV